MRLCLQVDTTSKSSIELGLEFAHFLTQFAEFLFESSDFVVDFVDGSRKTLLHLGER
jgi:hypothetical protein